MKTITINQPDDWHVHFRDQNLLKDTVLATAKHFARALAMPNLKPALTNLNSILAYHERILKVAPKNFSPYMTFYLNETVNPADLKQVKNYPFILGAKLYPSGATTNAEEGAKSLKSLYPLFEVLEEENLVLQIHGELGEGDIFEREEKFISLFLESLIKDFPRLRIVVEHISTEAAVKFVEQSPIEVAATITGHHLLYNRNKLLAGGIRPHYYCLPILKREEDQNALIKAATSGNPKFFAGSDSAPHAINQKESACGCAGIYSAPYVLAMYAEVFDNMESLSSLNNFMSLNGANFYGLPINSGQITLRKEAQQIPLRLKLGDTEVVPVAAGESLQWSVYS